MIAADTPVLTVIVPVYNTEHYLAQCVDSILNQSLKGIELLIVNDQSTDGSEAIIQSYKSKFNNVRCFSTEKKSLAGGSRNLALQHATGKYIGFVDSDDWIDTNMYERIIDLLERSQADIAVCGVMKEYESPHDVYYKYTYDIENVLDGKFAFELLSRRFNQDVAISPIVCNKVYRSSFLNQNGLSFLADNYCEDDVFNYLCFLKASKVALTPNAHYHYYQRRNSITHSFSQKHIDDLIYAFKVIKNYLDDNKLFGLYQKHYYAYFEKCAAFILNLLVVSEPNIEIQNRYLQHFFAQSQSFLSIAEYLEYCGTQRVKNFLNPAIIK